MKFFEPYIKEKCKDKNVLVLGCAGYEESGSFGKQYKMLKKCAKKLYGVDNNRDFVDKFKSEKVFYGDLNKFTWFDKLPADIEIIVATEVLEHLENPVQTLKYIKKKKNDSLTILISVPNGGSLGRLIHGVLNSDMFYFQDREHLCLFNKTTIKNTCESAGLEILEIFPYVRSSLVKRLLFFPNLASGYFVMCK